jgi:hypothetical protein
VVVGLLVEIRMSEGLELGRKDKRRLVAGKRCFDRFVEL